MTREELLRKKDLLRTLVKHEGFIWLREILKEQVEGRTQQLIRTPLKSMDEVLEEQYLKGEIVSLELVLHWPEIMISDIEVDLEQFKEKDND